MTLANQCELYMAIGAVLWLAKIFQRWYQGKSVLVGDLLLLCIWIYIWPIFVLWAVMDTIADYANGVIIAGRKPKHK